MANRDLGHFWLEYCNAVFTIVFLDPENLGKDTKFMLLSVIVLEISWIDPPYQLYHAARILSMISRELLQVGSWTLCLFLGFRGQGIRWWKPRFSIPTRSTPNHILPFWRSGAKLSKTFYGHNLGSNWGRDLILVCILGHVQQDGTVHFALSCLLYVCFWTQLKMMPMAPPPTLK